MSVNLKSFTIKLLLMLLVSYASAQGLDLSSGSWLRIRITEDGIYKLTGADLKKAGFPTAAQDAKKLAVFTHQGKMMSETRSEERRVGKECTVVCRSRWSPYH